MKLDPAKEYTIGQLFEPAMECQDQASADAYFAELTTRHRLKWGKTQEQAESEVRQNLGYFAGYFDNETRQRVEKLFHCAHPIFGSVANNGIPTPESAFAAGQSIASK